MNPYHLAGFACIALSAYLTATQGRGWGWVALCFAILGTALVMVGGPLK